MSCTDRLKPGPKKVEETNKKLVKTCSQSQARTKALNFMQSFKTQKFSDYQRHCGYSILCKKKEKFTRLVTKFANIKSFSVKKVEQRGEMYAVYFNESPDKPTSKGAQKFSAWAPIIIYYSREGCVLKQTNSF